MALHPFRSFAKALSAILGFQTVAGAVLALSVPLVSAEALANRITAPADPAKRCSGTPVPADVCERKRVKARDLGCVNTEEFQTLTSFGSFPSCDYDETPPKLEGWCPCGCFAEEVRVLGSHQEGPVDWYAAGDVAANRRDYALAALSPAATLSAPRYDLTALRLSTKGPELQPLFVIGTAFGRNLVLTGNHALLLASGRMTTARELKVGDELVSLAGLPVPVRSIERRTTDKDVVNFATDGNTKLQHVIAAEGVLVGDLLWQASFADDMNAVIIRQ